MGTGGNNKKRNRSAHKAMMTLRKYRRAERKKKRSNELLLLEQQQQQQQTSLIGNGRSPPTSSTTKIYDITRDPKAAHIPYCRIPPPFRGKAFTRKRNMDAYEAMMYSNAVATKMYKGDPQSAALIGAGLNPTHPNVKEALGTQAPQMNNDYSNTPQTQGGRNFGGREPGFEKLIFEPQINVQSIYESIMEVKVPAQSRNPGTGDESIFVNIPCQAPAFMDRRTLCFEMTLQVFAGNNVIDNNLEAKVRWSDHVSFVNNLVPSLFKNIDFQINNQHLTLNTLNQAFSDHMDILLNSEATREMKGELLDQLYIFERSGSLSNQRVVPQQQDGTPPTAVNAKALYFFRKLMQGGKVKVRFTPNHPFTNNDTLFSMANSIGITLTRNEPKFYVTVADESCFTGTAIAKAANHALAVAFARTLKISITDFKCRFYKYELSQKLTEEYINTYTIDHPDRFLFNHQEIRTIAINHTSQVCQTPLNLDTVPDMIVVTLRDKQAIIGTYETNPFEMYPIPTPLVGGGNEFKLEIKINSQSWRADPIETNSEAWFRIANSIFAKMTNPMINRHCITDNDDKPPSTWNQVKRTTGYPFYVFSLTFMGKGGDGTLYEDRRTGNIELFCELSPGAVWPNNYTWMIHAFSSRNYSISNEGQISKNFL